MRKMPLTASAPPARARNDERRDERVAEAEADDGEAPDRGRQHHRQAVAGARGASSGWSGSRRARPRPAPRRGGPGRAGPPRRSDEGGEERQRHAEDHGHEVHDVGADQLLPAARVAEAFEHAAQARASADSGGTARRGSSGPRRTRRRRSARSKSVGGGEAGRSDQRAAQGRPGDHADAAAEHRAAPPRPGSRRGPRAAA